LHAMWVHGSSVQPQREGYFINREKVGSGAVFKSHNTPGKGGEWFHFAIPTPVFIAGKKPKLKKVFVLYKTEGTARFMHLHIYDGEKKIHAEDGLKLSGSHSFRLDKENSWTLPSLSMKFGLGISVFIDFGYPATKGVPSIRFSSAGADFELP